MKKGFSFIQLVVAIAVIGMALTSIFSMNLQNNRRLKVNRDYLTVLMCMEEVYSQLKNTRYALTMSDKSFEIKKGDKKIFLNSDFTDKLKGKMTVSFDKTDSNIMVMKIEADYTTTSGADNTAVMRGVIWSDYY
ncbi:MAG: type II secretion system GspH family protein [Candidatus Muirbacterium halophilum]|nr:type II secretion system GspH family protein [Candidatus Muirbacterium halophilum]MCK9476031.1 type II secretion system GspH family protein [Candidatus Muirbacterium halophilum]